MSPSISLDATDWKILRELQRHGRLTLVFTATGAPHIYTLLVPLHMETSVLGQLLEALLALDYPCDRLDIKLIIEESDIAMQRALAGTGLPVVADVVPDYAGPLAGVLTGLDWAAEHAPAARWVATFAYMRGWVKAGSSASLWPKRR